MKLMAKGQECEGEIIWEGYAQSVDSCAAVCKPSAAIFQYGKCNRDICQCFCVLEAPDGDCKRKNNTEVDIYTLKVGKERPYFCFIK